MSLVKETAVNGKRAAGLIGHIDSSNAEETEKQIREMDLFQQEEELIIDASELEYISSAGLRVILRLRKEKPSLSIVNVSPEVYEVLEMTGFSEMMKVEKAKRKLSIEGCEVIGQGANGKVYRIDADTIVKVYYDKDALPDIQRERELAKKAFVLGIPTAIPYDVVMVDDCYGSVFELLNATSFANILIKEPERFDEVIAMSVDLLKKIHSTELKPGDMPDMKAVALNWAAFLEEYLPPAAYEKLHSLIEAVPDRNTMLHGDYHLKNVMLQGDEVLLIDMDTLCMGHPVFEMASIYNAYRGYSELDHQNAKDFLGISYEDCGRIWEKTLSLYLGTEDEKILKDVEKKSALIGYTRIMRRTIRRHGLENEEGKAVIENAKKHILELVEEIDSLEF